jgi:hypothetical protein
MSAERVMTSDIPLYLQLENRIGFFKHLFYSEIKVTLYDETLILSKKYFFIYSY